MDTDRLGIYLQDHHAGATAGHELCVRAAASNEGNDHGRFLTALAAELAEDRQILERVMDAVGAEPSRIKDAGAWMGEKLGRLKPNDSLTSYSPLSRLIEFEGLILGTAGRRSLWDNLGVLGSHAPPSALSGFDFDALGARAQRHLDDLDVHRRTAAQEAFAGS